jgi:hypothetical protein
MSDVPIPIVQLAMISLFVRRKRTCEEGWTNAGFTRRAATLMWAVGYIQKNGDIATKYPTGVIMIDDLFPRGLDIATKEDVATVHGHVARWFEFWSTRKPDESIETAMIQLLARLSAAKAGWASERQDAFRFNLAMDAIVAGKFEQYFQPRAADERL